MNEEDLLRIGQVLILTKLSPACVYEKERNGTFPKRTKEEALPMWNKLEVLSWIKEKENNLI